MKLKLICIEKTDKSTISQLTVDGVNECFVCEDKTRLPNEPKVFGETAIPIGTYGIIVTKSDRFSKMEGHDIYLPLLLNVPGYEGVRIHPGNKPEDTEGCLLPGTTKGVDSVGNSRTAWIQLNDKINAALKKGEGVTIEITR